MDIQTEFQHGGTGNAHRRRPGQSPGDQSFDWGRTNGLEAHGTRSPWIGTRMPHGLVILLASERRPRCAPVGPKRQFERMMLETLANSSGGKVCCTCVIWDLNGTVGVALHTCMQC